MWRLSDPDEVVPELESELQNFLMLFRRVFQGVAGKIVIQELSLENPLELLQPGVHGADPLMDCFPACNLFFVVVLQAGKHRHALGVPSEELINLGGHGVVMVDELRP